MVLRVTVFQSDLGLILPKSSDLVLNNTLRKTVGGIVHVLQSCVFTHDVLATHFMALSQNEATVVHPEH